MPKRRVAEPTAEYVGRKKATNLSLTPEAIVRGEAYARAENASLSQLVSRLLEGLPDPDAPIDVSQLSEPVRRLYGIARGAHATSEDAIDDYHRYLDRKYGAE